VLVSCMQRESGAPQRLPKAGGETAANKKQAARDGSSDDGRSRQRRDRGAARKQQQQQQQQVTPAADDQPATRRLPGGPAETLPLGSTWRGHVTQDGRELLYVLKVMRKASEPGQSCLLLAVGNVGRSPLTRWIRGRTFGGPTFVADIHEYGNDQSHCRRAWISPHSGKGQARFQVGG
jgi:hypothetical protein